MFSIKDFSNAFYTLKRAKGYAATVIVTLGITLGALVAMFNLNYQILAAPLPYADAERLIVGQTPYHVDGSILYPRVLPNYVATNIYRQKIAKVESMALVGYPFETIALRDKDDTPQVNAAYTTPEYMQLLQMPMLMGRAFQAEDGLDQRSAVVVISENTWRQHYGAQADIIGKTIILGETNFKIVGVADASFQEPQLEGPSRRSDIWLPWDFHPTLQDPNLSAINSMQFILAKLLNADDHAALEQQMSVAFDKEYQDLIEGRTSDIGQFLSFTATPLKTHLSGDSSQRTLWMLAGAVALLLIASVNIINLILSRAARQQRNMAIKAALGAQKKHLFLSILSEITLLMSASLLLALLVAQGGYALLQSVASDYLPHVMKLTTNLPSLLFAILTTVLLAFTFAQIIISQVDYRALNNSLQSSGKGGGLQISAMTRNILIISQISLTAVLLIGSIQILQRSINEMTKYVGFKTDSLYHLTLDEISPKINLDERLAMLESRKREMMEIRELLRQHPAINNISMANYAPVHYGGYYGTAHNPTTIDNPKNILTSRLTTTDEYFLPLLGIELKQGRNFTSQEVASNTRVLIVNEIMAKKIRPDGKVVGEKLYTFNSGPIEIIGVVNDYKLYNDKEPMQTYSPRPLWPSITFILQLKPGATITRQEINAVMKQVTSRFRTANIYSLADNLKIHRFADYLAAGLTCSLIILTLFLAFAGIYGVLSYSVQLRRFELGIRMSIGARPGTILVQILKENLKPVGFGLFVATLLLPALWFFIQQSNFKVELSSLGFLLPILLVILLTSAATLLSVWNIIRKSPSFALNSN